jgi:predicted nucleotidyltransferase
MGMTRDAAIAILRAHEAPLRRQGVMRAALFGSTARNEATADSDLDIMVDIDPNARVDLYSYVGITRYIAELFSVPVDVSDRAMLIAPVRLTAEADAVYAF